ncbi:hypothetical protein CVT24_003963 [Panaeolus cyanescens]|uniref:Enoyl reductase (ER) domain-containing protein n=1 Tax=Panaeolus cyanescens TaxID=181874 RepID=A0A409Y6J6_9AGAR|nr:hypothetical protein CVT24_003963 [Panaeolus cyanescens]
MSHLRDFLSDEENSQNSDNEDEEFHYSGDYSTQMEELFEGESLGSSLPHQGTPESLAGDDEDDDEDEGFLYDGVDAETSAGYREQLKDVLETDNDDDDSDDELSNPVLPLHEQNEPVQSRPTTPSDKDGDQSTPSSPLNSDIALNHTPKENPFLFRKPFLHPNISRLRSFTPQSSREVSNGSGVTSHSHIFGGFSPSPSHFSSLSRSSSTSNLKAVIAHSDSPDTETVEPYQQAFKFLDLNVIEKRVLFDASRKPNSILGLDIGAPTALASNGLICIGTSTGRIVVHDFKQSFICVCEPQDASVGAITALALSHDHTFIASGHITGFVQLFNLKLPKAPVRTVPPTNIAAVASGRKEGHLEGSKIVRIGFVAGRHTALVSADEHGLAFFHSLGKVLFIDATDILRILGRYPNSPPSHELARQPRLATSPYTQTQRQRYTILDMAPLPLGTVPHLSDNHHVVALLTPTKLVVVGLKPTPLSKVQQLVKNPKTGSSNTVEVEVVGFQAVAKFHAESDVFALQWLNHFQIILLLHDKISIYDTQLARIVETSLFDVRTLVTPTSNGIRNSQGELNSTAISHSIRTYKGKIVLLMRDHIRIATLLTWADRILGFVQAGDFLKAIELTRSYYLDEAPGNRNNLPKDPTQRKQVIGDKLRSLMDASAQYAFSEERMRDHTHITPDGRGVDRTDLFEELVAVCCRASLAMDDWDFLFEDLYQKYEENGIVPIYLRQLQPFIVGKEINFVAPRITQKLVALYEADNQPEQVERIIWHMDPSCLDLNQALRLCQKYALYDALIYIFTRALKDYVSPVVEMMGLIRTVQQFRRHQQECLLKGDTVPKPDSAIESLIMNAYKVYPYLANVLSGLTYPSEEPLDDTEALRARQELYKFLFFGRSTIWPPGPDGKLILTSDEDGGTEPTYPYARQLLSFDSESFLHTLDIAFEDAYLNDDESQDINRLVIIRVLLEILSSPQLPLSDKTMIQIFIARNVPKYPQFLFLQMAPSTLHNILIGLARNPDTQTREDRQLAAEYLLSVYNPHDIEKVISIFEDAGFYRILRSWHYHDASWSKLLSAYINDPDYNRLDVLDKVEEVLRLASRSNSGDISPELFRTVSDALPRFLNMDIRGTAVLIDKMVPDMHERALELLSHQPDGDESRYEYLSSLIIPNADDGSYKRGPSPNLSPESRRLFFTLQCRLHPEKIIATLEAVPPETFDHSQVLAECESSGAYDAVIWATNWQGDPQGSLQKANRFQDIISRDISKLLSTPNAANCEEQMASLQAISSVGREICLARSREAEPIVPLEDMWFSLLQGQIQTIQVISSSTASASEGLTVAHPILGKLRSSVQQTFGALVSITSTTAISLPHLFKRLVNSTPSSLGSHYTEFRIILTGILESYRSDEDLLVMVNQLVKRDLYDSLSELAQERILILPSFYLPISHFTMRAFVINQLTHPSNVSLATNVPVPKPGKDQVLVDVYSAGLNFFDILQAQGKYQHKPPLPFILGTEFAGKIADDSPIPEGSNLRRGQRVFGAQLGSFADKIVTNAASVIPLPDNISFDQGAGLYVTWPTSYEALVGRAELKKGEWVLVTAAAGGVGIAAVQIAKALGANVIAAAGSPEKLEIAKKYGGADYGVNYSKPGWQKEVLELTKGKGVDVIYDPVGLINDALKCIAWKGRALVIGFAAGTIEKVPMNLVLLKNISLVGLHWGAYTLKEPSRIPVVWENILSMFASGKVQPVVYNEIYTLEGLVKGLAALEKRETWGKAIVRVKDEKPAEKAKL